MRQTPKKLGFFGQRVYLSVNLQRRVADCHVIPSKYIFLNWYKLSNVVHKLPSEHQPKSVTTEGHLTARTSLQTVLVVSVTHLNKSHCNCCEEIVRAQVIWDLPGGSRQQSRTSSFEGNNLFNSGTDAALHILKDFRAALCSLGFCLSSKKKAAKTSHTSGIVL